jgi:hypothetical protein
MLKSSRIGQSAAKRLGNKMKVQRLPAVAQNGPNRQECGTLLVEIRNNGDTIHTYSMRVPRMAYKKPRKTAKVVKI